jgi:hypothetical protein
LHAALGAANAKSAQRNAWMVLPVCEEVLLICPYCGKRTLLDFFECPRCGANPAATSEKAAAQSDASEVSNPTPSQESEQRPPKAAFEKRLGLWPAVNSAAGAEWAARQGAWAAYIVTAFTGFMVFYLLSLKPGIRPPYTITSMTYLSIAVMALCGTAILVKKSTVAAAAALLWYVATKITLLPKMNASALLLFAVFTLSFINSIRGCYSLRRMAENPETIENESRT